MTTREDIDTDTLADLTEALIDNETAELPDGRTLRLRVDVDEFYNGFEDCDAYGKIAPTERDRDTGLSKRPDGFDGSAMKISVYNDTVWWQPPADVDRSDARAFRQFREIVSDLASFGWKIVTVEVLNGHDAYRRPIVVGFASVGGVDDVGREYLTELVSEQITEALLDAESR